MSVTLNLMLLLTVAAGFLEADESESKQEQCFDQQINEIKAQRKEEMAFFRQAFATLDQKFEEMKLMFLQSTAKADNPFKYSLATTGQNKRTSKSRARRGVEDVGAVFVTLHDKALQTSSDVQRLLGATGELEEALQNISNDCSAIPFMLDEIKAIRKNQEFFKRPGSCLDLLNTGHTLSGPYTIYAGSSQKEIEVYCDQDTDGGGWTVFQRRQDGSVNFYRDWSSYETGFGNIDGEFWLGNNNIHQLTAECCHELRIDLEDSDGNKRYAKYDNFMVASKGSNYKLTVSGFSGDAGDSMSGHTGYQFSTKDRDNDVHKTSCSHLFKGGWWYSSCHSSNLNGLYQPGAHDSYADGVNWNAWKGYHYSLKFAEMKFRDTK